MTAIVYLLLGIIPPLIAGPVAGLAYMKILKRGKGWYLIPFWVLLVVVNLLVMFWVISSSGVWLPVASSSTCFFTPVAPILTVLVMRMAWRRLEASGGIAQAPKHWLPIGMVLIPVLQIGMFAALIIFAPEACKVGLAVCQGS
ncbi:MAG: hypothetical protein WCE68_11000 [Anaerolineales bacterium]